MSGLTVWSFIQFFLYAQVEDYQKYLNGTGFFEISGNMFIVIVCYPICDSINLNICHSFLAQTFYYKTKKEALLKKIKPGAIEDTFMILQPAICMMKVSN